MPRSSSSETEPSAQLHEGIREAGQGRPRDPGADLTHPGLAVRDPGVDDGRDTGIDHPTHVDPGRCAGELERRDSIVRVARQRDPVHLPRVAERIVRGAADEAYDGW